ncbi:MAG TPA: peptidylprolyl isomerase [Candidatus Limnocylindria bacterium]|nr:peptidylprolyl isomerase [Candidatus Limnocylindria bacterium]
MLRQSCATALAALFWLAQATRLLADTPQPPAGDEVLVSGKGIVISRGDLERDFRRVLRSATEQQQVVPEDKQEVLRAILLDQLVFMTLTTNHATLSEVKRSEFEAGEFIKAEKLRLGTPEEFQAHLRSQGLTEEQLRLQNFREVLSRTVIQREVNDQVKIPTSDIKAYYDENPARWETPARMQIAQIFFSTRDPQTGEKLSAIRIAEKKARAIAALDRAQKNEDFSALAKEFTEDEPAKARGGVYSVVRGQAIKELDEAGFAMKPGEISRLIESDMGFHILKLISKTTERKLPLEEVETQIREVLVQRDLKARLPEYSERIRKQAALTYSTNAPRRSLLGTP